MLVRESDVTRIDLRRIDPADIRALIDERYVLPGSDAARLTANLDARSEGNPFFLCEVLRTLEAERALRSTPEGWNLGDLSEIRVPALLRQVIDGRLARLAGEIQRLLAVAAIVGHEVPLGLWASVGQTEDETLLASVEQAASAHLIVVSRDGQRVQFAHALIREALYEGILPIRRGIWHRRIAEILAADANPDPDAVAHHFRAAADARAYDWLIQAGDRAHRAYALLAAADRFEAALAFLGTDAASACKRGWLLSRIARMRRMSDPTQGITYLDEAIGLATQAGDRLLVANALYDRGMLRNWTGNRRLGIADMEAGLAAMRELSPADQARRKSLPTTLAVMDGTSTLGAFALQINLVGRFSEARLLAERVVGAIPMPESGEKSDGSALGDTYYSTGRGSRSAG
jgi:hypothetical protein